MPLCACSGPADCNDRPLLTPKKDPPRIPGPRLPESPAPIRSGPDRTSRIPVNCGHKRQSARWSLSRIQPESQTVLRATVAECYGTDCWSLVSTAKDSRVFKHFLPGFLNHSSFCDPLKTHPVDTPCYFAFVRFSVKPFKKYIPFSST